MQPGRSAAADVIFDKPIIAMRGEMGYGLLSETDMETKCFSWLEHAVPIRPSSPNTQDTETKYFS